MEKREGINGEAVEQRTSSESEAVVQSGGKVHFPVTIPISTLLFCAEVIAAGVLCGLYSRQEDTFWLALTILFMVVPSVLIQLALTFIHRDLSRDQPLILLLHMLQLGPVIRCVEALIIYCRSGRKEEPYYSITRKRNLLKYGEEEIEKQIGQSSLKLTTHCNAFKRASVIQAFLGSIPQLTLQLYASVEEKYIPPERGVLMGICLASVTYGALICNVLAIQIKYDDYRIRMKPLAVICIVLWRVFEIATRVIVLVLFCTALKYWICIVALTNIFTVFFYPWIQFWRSKTSLPENIEKNFSKFGTVVVLCLVTFLYAGINMFCWSAVHLNLGDRDLIDKSMNWCHLSVHYAVRLLENTLLLLLWYFHKTDFYEYICTPFLVVQLLICYCFGIFFMLVFYQYCHPCRKLFSHNFADWLHCICCERTNQQRMKSRNFSKGGRPIDATLPI
ncbi:membrane transport protein XK-like [Protopterus annectens]|uniref:membrane transport protein XK-like n=1 Tax=Protopterus annectens TaxID=7888 RepID=UPI001CFA871C|nr:membrane transport protein XK-like [Protopterus annectens]